MRTNDGRQIFKGLNVNEHEASLEHRLSLVIQGATGEIAEFALSQAQGLLRNGGGSEWCDNWAAEDGSCCTIPLGPHPGWMHFDERSSAWWSQSKIFPFGNLTAADEARIERERAVVVELNSLEEAVAEARMWARHGYEIAQRSCTWSDFGAAPNWLTEGWSFSTFSPSSKTGVTP